MSLREQAAKVAAWLSKGKEITIVSHYDADGLCGCTILKTACKRAGLEVDVCILPQLTSTTLRSLSDTNSKQFLFVDVGSLHWKEIEALGDSWIIDHHAVEGEPKAMLNPWLEDLDGGKDACSSTLAFAVAEALDKENAELAPIAIIGLLADSHEKRGLFSINKEIVDDAMKAGLIEAEERLRLFGYERRNLRSLLVKSHDLQIPGVTNNPRGSAGFLHSLGIQPQAMFDDLTPEEKRTLLEEGMRRATRSPSTSIHFSLVREEEGYRDARQFSTLLNACGRLERAELAIAILEGDTAARDEGQGVVKEYRASLREAFQLQEEIREEGDGYIIINGKDEVIPSIIGTVCSMLTRSGDTERDTVVLGLAYSGQEEIKLSARVNDRSERNVLELLREITDGIQAQVGGHRVAAGGIVNRDDEEKILSRAEEVLADF